MKRSDLELIKKIGEGFILLITDEDGLICFVNKKFTENYGYNLEEIIGHNPSILTGKKETDFFYFQIWNSITNGKSWSGDFQNKTKSGELIWENKTIIPWNGYYLSLGNNITDEKDTAEEIKAIEKFSLVGEASSQILHEVMNKMAILSYGLLFIGTGIEKEDFDKVQTGLDKSKKSYDDILKIFNSMRGVLSGGDNDRGDAFSIIEEVVELVRFEIEKYKINIDLISNDIKLTMPKTKFSQIVHNIVKNSYSALRDNRNLDEYWIRIEINEMENFYLISFTDSGEGIPVELQSKIFQNLFTTKDDGTGLGLSYIKKIVEKELDGEFFLNTDCPNTQFCIKLNKD